ncbi:MAG TPA: radical SAM protein [Pyrinomonadaceae bacterium]|nr:radical SAM protein [Pyrinomonadaceae bacterium]
MSELDCIVIGYNDVLFNDQADKHRPFQDYNGTYSELKHNSVRLNGQRKNYMELLNHTLTGIHGIDPNLNAFEVPNLGAVYLTSFLRSRNFSVELINFYNFEKDRLADLLKESPRAVAITTTYYVEEEPIKEIIEFVRERSPQTRIILGGPYVNSLCADNRPATQNTLLKSVGADLHIVDSQGEATLAKVLECLRTGRDSRLVFVPNLIYQYRDSNWVRTHRVEERNNLDENAVNWRSFDPRFFTPTSYMRTARSCPFACSFCNYPAMSGDHTVSTVETVRHELRYLVDAGLKYIIFIDDTFNVPLPRFKQLCRMMIEEKFNLGWVSFFRCSNADDECFDLMKESGCLGVFLGIESGDQQILNNMNKSANVQRYKDGIRKLKERGILTYGSFIFGFPGETKQTIMNTIEFVEETSPTFFNVQLYFHDPMAPIHQRAEEFGIEGNYYKWRHNTMTWQEGVEWVEYMVRRMDQSLLLTLHGFSIWSLPYLLQNGFSVEQITSFARTAKKMLVKGLDDSDVSYRDEEQELAGIFSTWNPQSRVSNLARC